MQKLLRHTYISLRPFYFLLLLVFISSTARAQTEAGKRIILVGNAADAVKDYRFFDALKAKIPLDSNTIVLYLGNNMSDVTDTAALRVEADLVLNTEAKAFFIPGYLDWAKGHESGYKAIMRQQRFLKSLNRDNIKFYPGDGCPGPKKINLGNDAVMMIMDSQWWLHQGVKPDIESDCKYRSREEVLAEIEDITKDEFDKLILLVTHHPFENTGVHSGTFGLKQHIFPLTDSRSLRSFYLPLPIIGSLYPITSNAISSVQDLQNPQYQSLVNTGFRTLAGVNRALSIHPNTVFIAGQEHNLQLLKKDDHYYINSGAAGKPTRVRNNSHAVYVKQKQGVAVLEITPDKKLRSRFYLLSDARLQEDFSSELLSYATVPPLAKDTTTLPMLAADSTIAAASRKMANLSVLRRVLIGRNYRQEWSKPIRMQVLHLDRDKGGLKVTGIGGGHESKSLQLEDASGKTWSFRTSNKDLSAVIPEGFQNTVATTYIQDMLSASNPYGALVVPGLQAPLGIVHATPQVYFVPNDSSLGIFRPLFANNVGLIEERKPAGQDIDQVSTNEALNTMIDRGDHFADQKTYLRTRLVDFLIADFDRHHGQYSWGLVDSLNRKYYYPIPKDRDQAFYHNTGLIMDIMKWGDFSFMSNFPYHFRHIRNLGIVGAYLDMMFTNQLSPSDWQSTISGFRSTLTNEVIDDAVKRLPPEIYAIRGNTINAKLRSRRDQIAEEGMDYYSFISKKVNILGGNNDDRFKVSGTDSGMLVQVYAQDTTGEQKLTYSRTFNPTVTKELRFYGFNGNDKFEVDPSVRSGIRLRMIGGRGEDTFNIQGRVRNLLYDLRSENNQLLSTRRTTRMFSDKASVNEFWFRENLHNAFGLPLFTLGFNQDDGLLASISLAYRTFGFRKYPYASLQRLSASFASSTQAYSLRYNGEFIDVHRHFDLLLNAEVYNPVLRNFFGFGNETVRDTLKPIEYYRTRYNYFSGDLLVRKRFHRGNVMNIAVGPSAYYYWLNPKPNADRILERPSVVGLDSASVYSNKFYAGGKAAFTINTLNTDLLPTRGLYWNTEFIALQSLNETSKSYSRLQSTLDLYAELDRPNRLLVALHFGGGHIFSDKFEYFQALTLGGNNYLRGYRVNRFAGSTMAYGSAELRLKLFDFNAHIIKGDLGLVGFNDIGRVWMQGEVSKKWHHGYGGGIYLIPFNAVMVSALVGLSEEDTLFNFTIGTRLNMVFQGI
jgi:hypothetical protein